MSLFDNQLINQHNIELFDRINGSDIEIRNRGQVYKAKLESRIFKAYGEWHVILNALFIRDVHPLPPHFANFKWEGSGKDTIAQPVPIRVIYIGGKPLVDMVEINS